MFNRPIFVLLLAVQQLPASPAALPAATRNDQGRQSQSRQEGQPSLRPQAFSKCYCGPEFDINSHFKLGSGSLSPSRWRLHLRSQLCLPGIPSRGHQCPPLGLPHVNFKCLQVSFKSLHHRPVRRQVKCSMGPQSRRWQLKWAPSAPECASKFASDVAPMSRLSISNSGVASKPCKRILTSTHQI